MRIVIADDNSGIRRFLRRYLERRDHDCVEAESVAALVRACALQCPDLVISDVSMGDGDGIETCLKLLRGYQGLSVIIMTGDGENAARADDAGFEEVLAKPIDFGRLDSALKRVLAKRSDERI